MYRYILIYDSLLRSATGSSYSVRLPVRSLDLMFFISYIRFIRDLFLMLLAGPTQSKDIDVETLARDFVYIRVIAQFSTLYNSLYILLIFSSSLLRSLLHHL